MPAFSETSDFPAFFHQTVLLSDGDSFTGRLDFEGDSDWIPVQLDANRSYIIEYVNDFPRPELDIVDSSGTEISSPEGFGAGNTMVWATPDSSGIYYVQVRDRFSTEGAYTVTVRSEVANSLNTTEIITLSPDANPVGVYNGVHDYVQDQDWIKGNFDSGYTYLIKLADSVTNTFFRVLDSNEATIVSDGDSQNELDALAFTPDSSGEYYLVTDLSVNRLRPSLLQNENYLITVEVEPPGNFNTNFSASPGEIVIGSTDFFRDVDWHKVELSKGVSYVLNTISGSTTQLSFVDAGGVRVPSASAESSSRTHHILTPEVSGTYFVFAEGSSATYRYSFLSEVAGDVSTAANLQVGQIFNSSFEFGRDKDVISVDVVEGQKYTILAELDGTSTRRVNVNVLDSQGERLLSNEASGIGSKSREFTATSTGRIFIEVDEGSGIADTIAYSLSVVAGSEPPTTPEMPTPEMPTATFAQLIASNVDAARGFLAAYETLLGGIPNQAGFTFLIESAVATNFGAGAGVDFNQENIFINLVNNLVQGNQAAKTVFDSLATGATLEAKVTALYNKLIPPSKQSVEGLTFITRADGLKFYEDVANERGVAGTDGAAIVAMASILKIAVDGDFGIGNSVNDVIKAVAAGSAEIPASGTVLTQIEIADGTAFDGDDVTANAIAFSATIVLEEPTHSNFYYQVDERGVDGIETIGHTEFQGIYELA